MVDAGFAQFIPAYEMGARAMQAISQCFQSAVPVEFVHGGEHGLPFRFGARVPDCFPQ